MKTLRCISLVVPLLSFLATCRGSLEYSCKQIEKDSPTLRLKRYLFCDYDVSVRPVTDKNRAINVSISLAPKFMDFVQQTSIFVLHSWVYIHWVDEHLTWKPEDYNGVDMLHVKSDAIWVPDFSVYNSGDMDLHQSGVPETTCQLLHTGKIICVPSLKINIQCDADYTYWPYDTQECAVRMGSWTHTGEEISLDFRRSSVDMTNYSPHKEWRMSNYSTRKYSPKYNCCPNDTFPTLILDIELERHSPVIQAVFVTPALALMVITLTVLWLDSNSIERISLSAVNFICHLMCIYDLHWMLPPNGPSPPHILLYYRDSMILATFAMVITTILRKIRSMTVSPPSWIVTTVQLASSNAAGRFLLLSNGTDTKVLVNSDRDEENTVGSIASSSNRQDSWRMLALIVEWLAFILAVLTYTMLIILRIPLIDYYSNSDDGDDLWT